MKYRPAEISDETEILSIYHSNIGLPGCTWDDDYPSTETIKYDISVDSLHCMTDDENSLIAVASLGKFDELDDLSCWDKSVRNWCDLMRIGVRSDLHGQGYGSMILDYIIKQAVKENFDGMRIIVSKTNPKALGMYHKFNFKHCGETNKFDIDWYCYELKL